MADGFDTSKPFGFCTRSSRTDAGSTYNITGGGCYTYPVEGVSSDKVITLVSNGSDMKSAIQNAIKKYDVIILDGSQGDFIVSSSIGFERGNKTIIGINNARLCTKWQLTEEIRNALDAAGVPDMSSSSGGGTLPNGKTVKEEAEFNTRKIIIDLTGDKNEDYQKSGIFSLNRENVIIRNITFVGPGSVDVGGYDLISATGAKHCWIDHCAFLDGMDGNFDITNSSDFITVSYCTFSYTSRSYMHQNTNLVGSSDSEAQGYLNTTFAFNWWGTGCNQRMPMARVGKIHMLNNYFSCAGNSSAINPRKNSEFLIEGNYFDKGVKKYYRQDGATAVTWDANNYIAEASSLPASMGSTVSVPYDYSAIPCNDIPAIVRENAGATLPFVSSDDPTPDTEAKTCTVSFNGTDSQNEAGYFTFGEPYDTETGTGNKHSFNSKFAGTYDGVAYEQGLKMEGSTIIQFTNQSSATVVIVQSTWSNYTLKLDDTELDVTAATTPAGSSGVRVYTIEAVAPGQHKITRGNGESGILRVEVHEKGSSSSVHTLLPAATGTMEYHSLDGRRLTAKPATKGIYIVNGHKVVMK